MSQRKREYEPVQQSVHVDCPIDEAFYLFTARLSEWWPLSTHSIDPNEAEHCEIEPWRGGRVFERARSGDERDWGSVTVWSPPARVKFTWHPRATTDDQTIDIEFHTEADGTRVTLTHTGWQLAGVATSFSSFVAGQLAVMA